MYRQSKTASPTPRKRSPSSPPSATKRKSSYHKGDVIQKGNHVRISPKRAAVPTIMIVEAEQQPKKRLVVKINAGGLKPGPSAVAHASRKPAALKIKSPSKALGFVIHESPSYRRADEVYLAVGKSPYKTPRRRV